MRFTFVLTARYPTHKAYGVTTTGSVDALRKLGHSVEVITANYQTKTKRVWKTKRIFTRFITFSNYIAKCTFKIKQLRFGLELAIKNKKSNLGIIWTREVILAFFIISLNPNSTLILETHQIPNLFERKILVLISRKKSVIVCPIKDYIAQETGLKKGTYVILPMAAPNSFIEKFTQTNWPKQRNNKISILYLGRAFNTHENLNLRHLCKNFESLIQETERIEITILGIDSHLVEPYLTKSSLKEIQIISNLPHNEVFGMLKVSDIGILAYPNSPYYRSVFPIKLVEYAASKTLIVASDTPGHREILGENLALYFSLSEEFALKRTILNVIQQPSNHLKYVLNAFEWSKSHSYESRVLKILDEIMARNLNLERQEKKQ